MSDHDDNGSDLERDEEALADIIRLFPEQDEHDAAQPGAKGALGAEQKHCRHARVWVHGVSRKVTCRDCDAEIDAFTIVMRWTQDWDRIVAWRKEADRRATATGNRLSELLRLERNARTRLRRIDPEAEASSTQKPWGSQMPL